MSEDTNQGISDQIKLKIVSVRKNNRHNVLNLQR